MAFEAQRPLALQAEREAGESAARLEGRAARALLDSLLEISRALAASRELHQALRDALEVLNRHPSVVRSAITLVQPEAMEVIVDEAVPLPEGSRGRKEHGFFCTTLTLDACPIGALAVDLRGEAEADRERTEQLLEATAELVADAVRIRQLHASAMEGPPLTPGESLAEMVSRYEKGLIESALRATRGNRARAARLLRTTERILGYRVQQYGIDCGAFRG